MSLKMKNPLGLKMKKPLGPAHYFEKRTQMDAADMQMKSIRWQSTEYTWR